MKDLGKVIFEHATGNVRTEYSQFKPEEREEAISKAFFEAIGMPNGFTNKREFKKAMRRNEVQVYEIIEEIVNGVINDFDANGALAERFTEERFLDLGDTNEFYLEGGDELEVVEYAGSHWDVARQRLSNFDSITVKPKDYIISVYEYMERVASGRADWGYLVNKVAEAIAKKKREVVHTTLVAGLNVQNAPFGYTGSYQEREILSLVAHVEAGNGFKPVLIGTKTALARLQGMTTEAYGNEKNAKGFVSNWMGYECIELTNALDPAKAGLQGDQLQLPKDEIYVVSGAEKFIKVVNEGAEVSRERTPQQMADQSHELTVTLKFGVAAVYNSYVGRIKINA